MVTTDEANAMLPHSLALVGQIGTASIGRAKGMDENNARLAQLIKGSELNKDEAAHLQKLKSDERDANLRAIIGARSKLPPGSNVHYGDVSVDTKDPSMLISPGQHAADTAFGKEYSDYIASGGNEAAKKNLGLLEGVQTELKAKGNEAPNWIERGVQYLPDAARSALTPEIKRQEDSVRTAVQASLRQTLGAQFTEKEGESLMRRSYDPRLSPAVNLKKMEPEIAALKNQIAQKMRSSQYFEQHKGTLRGLGAASGMGGSPAPAAPPSSPDRTPVKTEVSPSTGKKRITYSDGTVEVQ